VDNPARSARRWFSLAAKLTISTALLAWLFWKFGLDAEALTPLSFAPLVIGLTATCLQPVVASLRWHIVIQLYAYRISFRDTMRIQYVSGLMNQFLPGLVGGDAVRVYLLHKHGARLSTAIASALLDRTAALLGLILIVIASVPRIVEIVEDESLKYLLLGSTVVLLTGTAALMKLSGVLHAASARREWLSPLAMLASGLRDLFSSPRPCVAALALSISMHLLSAAVLWLSLIAFGRDLPFADVLAVFAPIIVFQMLPFSIGGWGVRELAAAAMFAAIGVDAREAIVASICLGILSAMASLPGVVAWLLPMRVRRPPD
jgi:uncharacterized protein (TIRG00374 family)